MYVSGEDEWLFSLVADFVWNDVSGLCTSVFMYMSVSNVCRPLYPSVVLHIQDLTNNKSLFTSKSIISILNCSGLLQRSSFPNLYMDQSCFQLSKNFQK